MKNILLPILFLCSFVSLQAQSVDVHLIKSNIPQLASYPNWATESFSPSCTLTSIIIVNAEVSFEIIRLSDNSVVHNESQSVIVPQDGPLLVEFNNLMITDLGIGDYQIRYEVSTDFPDPDVSDNLFTHNFKLTENEFAFGLEPNFFAYPHVSNYEADEPHSWAYGGMYKFENLPLDTELDKVSFSINNATELAGHALQVTIYTWNGILDFDGNISPNARETVAFGLYPLSGDELPGEFITIDIISITGHDWVIDQDKIVLFSFEHNNPELGLPAMQLGVDTSFYNQQSYNTATPLSFPFPDASLFLGINGDLSTEPYEPAMTPWFLANAPELLYLPPPASTFTLKIPTNTEEDVSQKHQIKLLQNPVQDLLQLEINSQALQPKYINIYNTMGQSLYTKKLDKVSDSMEISVGDFPDGTYYVIIVGDNGQAVSTFVKTK